jgi:DNA-binding transcriptional LysR family regulator
MDVHLRDLRYFVAVAEELHFTRAAERLFVSQPALSKQVRALERQLGVELLVRGPRSVSLSAAGAALLDPARALLDDWDEAVRAVGAPALVLGLQTAVGRDLLRDALSDLRATGVRVSLRLVPWVDPSAGLADRTSDVALVWLPLALTGVRTRVLATEERWVALPAGHPLAARERVGYPDLVDEAFVALPASAGPLRDFWLALDARSAPPVIGAEAESAEATFEAVAAGLGVALLAAGNADLHRRSDVVCRPVDGLEPARLALAWRADDDRPSVRALVAAF